VKNLQNPILPLKGGHMYYMVMTLEDGPRGHMIITKGSKNIG
jgi:hypothetical protein